MKAAFIIVGMVLSLAVSGQTLDQALKRHIQYLASDQLEGRLTGTKGEALAADYIDSVLTATGAEVHRQSFEFIQGRMIGAGSQLALNGKPLRYGYDYSVCEWSGSDSFAARFSLGDEKGDIWIIQRDFPAHNDFHGKQAFQDELRTLTREALEQNAPALMVWDSTSMLPTPDLNGAKIDFGIPVFYLAKPLELPDQGHFKGFADIRNNMVRGHNVIGRLDFGAQRDIIIGGHYDHLGFGEHGSLHTGFPAIHNGADDNASGVALFMELARQAKAEGNWKSNLVFIGFSGEELGLVGSKYYAENPIYPLEQVSAMLNFDMVGRLDSVLVINGTGTALEWDQLIDSAPGEVIIQRNPSGIGPSDHTSFYLKDIPALHFFTGAHEHYHRPEDDEEHINYPGVEWIHHYVYALLRNIDNTTSLTFQKTAEKQDRKVSPFKVTFGILPDYIYTGVGLKVDGLRANRPAEKAGIQSGDIILRIGDIKVRDIYDYMDALGAFDPGQKAEVEILRDEERLTVTVHFES